MMKSIAEYTSAMSSYELYHFLAEAIMQNDISNFSELLKFAEALPVDAKTSAVYVRLFPLIRKLSWGFFRDVTPEVYPKVWREIVLPHSKYPQCGDLKHNLTISEIYVGIIDLHGYTRFCEKNKNNLSMLQVLDDTIQKEMSKRARAHDVVLQRRQGDEMVLVGASAVDLLAVSLEIIDYFSNRSGACLDAEGKLSLPKMHVSGGVAGGKKFTPFIITRDGDLSGGVVNSAARLQARANELSGERSRIVVSKTVQTKFLAEMKELNPRYFQDKAVGFFDSGVIRFKGIEMATCEVIADESDRYKLLLEKDMLDLYRSLEASSWEKNVFERLIYLLIKLYKNISAFGVETMVNGFNATLDNDSLVSLAKDALARFNSGTNYAGAIDALAELVGHTKNIPGIDRLCMEYATLILDRYRLIGQGFKARLDAQLKEKSADLPLKHKQLYDDISKSIALKERLDLEILKMLTPLQIGKLWTAVTSVSKENEPIAICSGKQ